VVDVPNTASDRELLINIVAADSSFAISTPFNVRLPTIALVDREAAEEFAKNIVAKVYLELPFDSKTGPRMKLRGDSD
jgi:hypothetical protein